MKLTAMAPSPTAGAQRLTDPFGTSPAVTDVTVFTGQSRGAI